MVWLKYHPDKMPKFDRAIQNEIDMLDEMCIVSGGVYTNKDGEKRIVTMYGYPRGAVTSETTIEGVELKNDKGEVVRDDREYHTPNANGAGKCYINYFTVKDMALWLKHRDSFNQLANKKVMKIKARTGEEYFTTTVTEFAKWLGWKRGDDEVECDVLPDTTPREMTSQAKEELKIIEASLMAGKKLEDKEAQVNDPKTKK